MKALLQNENSAVGIYSDFRGDIKRRITSLITQFQNISTQEFPTNPKDIAKVMKVFTSVSVYYMISNFQNTTTIFDMLEAISLNQLEVRKDLRAIIDAVSKDEVERQKMLIAIYQKIKNNEDQIQQTLNKIKDHTPIVNWIKKDFDAKSRVANE